MICDCKLSVLSILNYKLSSAKWCSVLVEHFLEVVVVVITVVSFVGDGHEFSFFVVLLRKKLTKMPMHQFVSCCIHVPSLMPLHPLSFPLLYTHSRIYHCAIIVKQDSILSIKHTMFATAELTIKTAQLITFFR